MPNVTLLPLLKFSSSQFLEFQVFKLSSCLLFMFSSCQLFKFSSAGSFDSFRVSKVVRSDISLMRFSRMSFHFRFGSILRHGSILLVVGSVFPPGSICCGFGSIFGPGSIL